MKTNRHIWLGSWRKYILLWLLTIYAPFLGAQSEQTQKQSDYKNQDLKGNLSSPAEDTFEVQKLIKRADEKFFAVVDPDSMYLFLHRALFLSKKINYPLGVTRSYGALGYDYAFRDQLDSGRYYLRLAITEAKKTQDNYRLTLYYLWYGWIAEADSAILFYKTANRYAALTKDTFLIEATTTPIIENYLSNGKMIEATKLCLESVRRSQLMNDTMWQISNYCRLGNIFGTMNLRDKQMNMVHAALKLSQFSRDSQLLCQVYSMAAEAYLHKQEFDSVIYYVEKTQLLTQTRIKYYPAIQTNNWYYMADAYLNKGQIDSTKKYYHLILDVLTFDQLHSVYLAEFGKFETKFGNREKADEYFRHAEEGVPKEELVAKAKIYRLLYEHYNEVGQESKAFRFLKSYRFYEDSIQKNEMAFNAEYLMIEFEAQKREEQIKLVAKENELQTILAVKQKQKKNIAYGSIGLIFLIGGIGFYRFRQYKNLKNKQALSNERLRISQDLHDEVGATLSGIVMYSHLAKGQIKEMNSAAEGSINIVQETASEMVNKLNDVVWLVNPLQDNLEKLIEKLEEYATRATSAKNMYFNLKTQGNLNISISIDLRKNIYLISKEAINNAVKYSEGTVVELYAEVKDHLLEVMIRDNGIGFKPDLAKRGSGLNNMQHRAEEINATYSLSSDAVSGTKIYMTCKIT